MSRYDVSDSLLARPRILTTTAALLALLSQAGSVLAAGAGGTLGP